MELRAQLQRTLGDAYTVERELGGGGMSRVFVADEHRLGRQVVIKVLAPDLAAAVNTARFEREIRLAASLQQANIVPVLAAGETDGLPFYTMPFVEGESLRARLGKGQLSVTGVLRILGDVARALGYAHDRGIAHRDIKPDNVLLSGGTAVVMDFGIAKALAASQNDTGTSATLTQLGTAIGTPAYMSPEQAGGDPAIDHRTDIYSFGCMAYELLAGRAPFAQRTPQRMLAAHLSETPAPVQSVRPDTPPALADLVMRCLAKDASERPQNAAEIVRILDAASSGSAVAMPAALAGGPGTLGRALALYAVGFVAVAVLARAALVTIGLPDWVVPGAMIVMALGLPAILGTAYVQRVTRRALLSTPNLTPGGSNRALQGTLATLALKASPHVSWRRTAVGGVYAIGAFALLVGAYMGMRALGIGPAASLLTRGVITENDDLLIADFRAGEDTSLANVVTEAVRDNLSSAFSLVPPVTVLAALERMQRERSTRVELPVAREVAQREGARAIVDGEITPVGTGYVIALTVVTADSGRQLTSVRTSVGSPGELIDGIDKLSRKLRGRIGESLRAVQASPPLARVTTGSLPALRLFTEAVRANRDADYPRAVALAREAVAIDSTFAGGWRLLAGAGANGNTLPVSAIDSALTMAFIHRDRLDDDSREVLEAQFFRSGPGRDLRRASTLYERMFARDSNVDLGNVVAIVNGQVGNVAKAESLYRWILERDPDYPFAYGNIVPVLLQQGKIAAAESILALAGERHPSYLTAHILNVDLRYVRGDAAAYRRGLDSLEASAIPRLHLEGANRHAGLAWLEGRLRDANRWRAEVRRSEADIGRHTPELVDIVEDAFRAAWLADRKASVVATLDSALGVHAFSSMHPLERPDFLAAITYALAGAPHRARRLLDQFANDVDTTTLRVRAPERHEALGYIALADGDARRALAEFAQGEPWVRTPTSADLNRRHFHLGMAHEALGQRDSAIANYERYRDSPQVARAMWGSDPTFLARVHRGLGNLYAESGDRTKAIASYTAFIRQWRNADAELQPQVADVRRRLQALGGG